MNDLYVESYDAKEVENKKQSIAKRAAVAGSAVMLTLGLFNFAGCIPLFPIVAGGAGAWFHSCLEDGCECPEGECECTEDECKFTKDE